MYILAIESSCDETSIALLHTDVSKNKSFLSYIYNTNILGSVISSQIMVHRKYGGIIPEIGAREHAKNIHEVLNTCLKEAAEKLDWSGDCEIEILEKIQAICVTTQPGLVSALRVGLEMAKSLQFFIQQTYNKNVDIIPVNHLHGHVASCFFRQETIEESTTVFPHLHLLVSGGNSQIIIMNSWSNWQIVGKTLDDAAGECFDKCGRMLGLPYPAGVAVSLIAKTETENSLNLPVGMEKNSGFDVSFSGLKTAVRYDVQKQKIPHFEFEKALSSEEINELIQAKNVDELTSEKLRYIKQACQSVQMVIVKQLMNKFKRAIKEYNPVSLGLSGGVSANPLLRKQIQEISESGFRKVSLEKPIPVFLPSKNLTGDNAVMIGLAGMLNTCL